MAEYFEWQDSYSVGVREFDDAHKKLLGITNELATACMEGKPLEQLTDLLLEVIRYTRFHFRDEEDMLRDTGFELLKEHRAEHDALFDQVLTFADDFFHGRFDKTKITEFMISWLLSHILEEDMKYKEHFAKLAKG